MWLFPLRQGKVMKVIDNWAYISSLAIILLAYYLVYCPSFPRQRGLDSETCLDGLIAFLHSLRSWAKEVDDRSLPGSLLMLSNHFLLGWPQMKLIFSLKFKTFLGHFSSSRHWRWPNQRRRLYLITSSMLEIPIRVFRSDIDIFSHNLTEQIHLTISDKSVNVIYFNAPSFTIFHIFLTCKKVRVFFITIVFP